MGGFLLRKVGAALIVLVLASMLVFVGVRAIPGDPALALGGESRDPAVLTAIRHKYGLDKPVPVQYLNWASLAVRGDLGTDQRELSVSRTIVQRLPITLELAEDITVQADERKLRQVVFNLLSNAVKFTPAGGHVDVSAHEADGVVTVAVTDTGPGIAPEDETLIFDEFQQARGGSNGADGTGLGLPLARRFIELHGGRLWVETARGSGSSFRFTLPIDPVL